MQGFDTPTTQHLDTVNNSNHTMYAVLLHTCGFSQTLGLLLHVRPCIYTGFTETVWPTAILQPNGTTYNSVTTFYVVANVGVILFMFLLGCELDQRLLSRQWKKSAPIALSAIAFPFGVGCAASLWLEVRPLVLNTTQREFNIVTDNINAAGILSQRPWPAKWNSV